MGSEGRERGSVGRKEEEWEGRERVTERRREGRKAVREGRREGREVVREGRREGGREGIEAVRD